MKMRLTLIMEMVVEGFLFYGLGGGKRKEGIRG